MNYLLFFYGFILTIYKTDTAVNFQRVFCMSYFERFAFLQTFVIFPSGCGGVYTTPTGLIHSPNHPDFYPHNINCEWNITVAEFQTVKITFKDFDIEVHDTCLYDYVVVSV